jgi:hypothetical protein
MGKIFRFVTKCSYKHTDVSEERIASISWIEEEAKQVTSNKQAVNCVLGLLIDHEEGSEVFLRNVGR